MLHGNGPNYDSGEDSEQECLFSPSATLDDEKSLGLEEILVNVEVNSLSSLSTNAIILTYCTEDNVL